MIFCRFHSRVRGTHEALPKIFKAMTCMYFPIMTKIKICKCLGCGSWVVSPSEGILQNMTLFGKASSHWPQYFRRGIRVATRVPHGCHQSCQNGRVNLHDTPFPVFPPHNALYIIRTEYQSLRDYGYSEFTFLLWILENPWGEFNRIKRRNREVISIHQAIQSPDWLCTFCLQAKTDIF